MSLINQMLRDLDSREAERPTLRAVETPAPVHKTTEKKGGALRMPLLLLSVLVLLVCGWLLYPDLIPGSGPKVVNQDRESAGPSVPEKPVTVSGPVNDIKPSLDPTKTKEEQTADVVALTGGGVETTQVDEVEHHATTEAAEEQNQPSARQPFEPTVTETIEAAPALSHSPAQTPQQSGAVSTTAPVDVPYDSKRVADSEQIKTDLSEETETIETEVPEPVLRVRPRPKPSKESSSHRIVSTVDAPNSEVIQVKSKRVLRDPVEQLYQTARNAYTSGQVVNAISKLGAVLEARPGHLEARELLILLHMNAGDLDNAAHVIEQGLLLHPGEPALMANKARIAIAKGEPNRARRILVAGLTDHSNNLELLTMLGVLLQQSGDFDEAISVYQRLVMLETNESRHWAGLAISYDAGNNGIRALEAYLQALKLGNLPSNVAIYAERRVQELRFTN